MGALVGGEPAVSVCAAKTASWPAIPNDRTTPASAVRCHLRRLKDLRERATTDGIRNSSTCTLNGETATGGAGDTLLRQYRVEPGRAGRRSAPDTLEHLGNDDTEWVQKLTILFNLLKQ